MLQRLTLAAALDQVAQAVGLLGGELLFEVEIELEAGQLEQMAEEQFGMETRGFDSFFLKEIRALANHFENGHSAGGFQRDQTQVHHSGAGLRLGLNREGVSAGFLELEAANFAGDKILEVLGLLDGHFKLLLVAV